MWQKYINAVSIDQVLEILDEKRDNARIVAGATDLILELERGIQTPIDTVIDITRIAGLDQINVGDDGKISIGPLVTHNQASASPVIRERLLPLALATWGVGAPQIRNRGTIAGNLITASPANDTITPLIALNASIRLVSMNNERIIPLNQFYEGVRKTIMKSDEFLTEIIVPSLNSNKRGSFLKLGLRKAQAISVVNACVVLDIGTNGTSKEIVKGARITLGAVAPTIIRAKDAEAFLAGKPLDDETIKKAASLAMEAAKPIDDIRGSAAYRKEMIRVLVKRNLLAISKNDEDTLPEDPVLLSGAKPASKELTSISGRQPIVTSINGGEYVFEDGHDKTLLELLRDDGGLIGTKEGCGEGECGACTIILDGDAVMSCLVPAERAHNAEIVTIEGLADKEKLHPVQDAFVHEGAVQCGYCIPGFIMSAAKLLEEKPDPTRNQIEQAITGNLCRCTGYYKIVQAIEKAAKQE